MRLQTENRRQSMVPIDVSRASAATLSSFMSPPSSKRASFVPLTGSGRPNGHRRISSVSDSFGTIPTPELTPSPNVHAFNIAAAEAALSGRRSSGFFGRPADLDASIAHSVESSPGSAAVTNTAELEALLKELQALKNELHTAKHDLVEAKEAKEASESCVTVLREFIAENSIGAGGPATNIKLPPPPTMTTGQEELAESKKTGTGWGFKLWGSNTGVDSPLRSSTVNNIVPHSAALSTASLMVHSMNPPSSAVPIGAAPLSRKLGGFFSSRSSISSNHSRDQSLPAPLHLPQLQTNAASTVTRSTMSIRDSMYSHSDASSIAEPVSPGSDINGLGTAGYMKTVGLGGSDDVVVHTHELTSLDGTPVRVSVSAVDLDGLR